MEQRTVRSLEGKLEDAVDDVIVGMGLKRLPLLPNRQTMHLMAEAAVAVHKAAVENQEFDR